MRKLIIGCILLFVAGIASGLLYVRYKGAEKLSQYLTQTLGTPVSVGSLSISWNHIGIKNIAVQNLQKGPFVNAFEIPSIEIDAKFWSFFQNNIDLEKVVFNNPTITIALYNLNGTENNWGPLINRIPPVTEESVSAKSKDKELYIHTLLVQPLNIILYNMGVNDKMQTLPQIPKIELHNIGTAQNALTYSEALGVIAQAIINAVIDHTGLTNLLQGVWQLPQNMIKSMLSPVQSTVKAPYAFFKKLFGGENSD